MKRVSVVLCTYNGSQFILEQLNSIVRQTYPVFEVLIQDDGSTDGTRSILQEYQNNYSHIHCFFNEYNIGFNANFWSVLEKASGDFIAIADQDDVWLPQKIERLVTNIGENDLIYADSISFYEKIPKDAIANAKNAFSLWRFITLQTGVLGHDCLIKRNLINRVPKACKYSLVYDFALALVALSENKLSHISEGLTYFRRHPLACSNLFQKKGNRWWGYIACFLGLSLQNRNDIALRYKTMLPFLKGQEKLVYRYALYLSSGRILDLLRACVLTYQNRAFLKEDSDSILNRIRSFFIPLFLYGKWSIIKDLWGIKR